MQRLVSISLLLVMGLIANQLPILWTSYQTYNQRYATFYCVNPGTSCNGSCTMQREFLERTMPEDASGKIPPRVLTSTNELSPSVLFLAHVPSATTQQSELRTPPHTPRATSFTQRPPTPPPAADPRSQKTS